MAANAEASSSTAQTDAAGRTATPMNRNNPAFLNKLRSMLDDKSNEDLIRWAPDGKSFFVPNHIRFGDTLLPRYFKHRNFSSFVRQLNMYGFHKVPHLQQGALDADQAAQSELWEFTNELFTRDEPELTAQVQRKKATKNTGGANQAAGPEAAFAGLRPNQLLLTDMPYTGTGDGNDPSFPPAAAAAFDGANPQNLHLHPLFPALQAITVAQTNINSELSRLRSSNDDLWREAIDTRQRLKKQQDTVNKVIRFLAGVFGGRALANVSDDDGVGGVGAGVSSGTKVDPTSSARSDGNPATAPSGTSALDSARRVAVYRPSMTANGRLLIGDGSDSGTYVGAQASSSRGGIAAISPVTDQVEGRQAEIFELPEIEEVHDDGSRFIETVSPSESPPGGSSLKLKSPSLQPQDAQQKRSSSASASMRKSTASGSSSSSSRRTTSQTPTNPIPAASQSQDAGNAASNWLASLLGSGAASAGEDSASGSGSGSGSGAGVGSGSAAGGVGSLSAAATSLDAGAMAALQSLFNSTAASPIRNSFSAGSGLGLGSGSGQQGPAGGALAPSSVGAGAGSADFASALSLPTSLAGTLAASAGASSLFPPGGLGPGSALWPASTSGGLGVGGTAAASAPLSTSSAMVLPSINGFADASSMLVGNTPSSSSGAGSNPTAAAQMVAANPELARHTAELGQNYEDMQRVNSYLQALIDGVMQGQQQQQQQQQEPQQPPSAPGSSQAVPPLSAPPSSGLALPAGGLPSLPPPSSAGAANASTPIDLEALLHEFLVPAAAATPPPQAPSQTQSSGVPAATAGATSTAPSPRSSFVDPKRRIENGPNGLLHLPGLPASGASSSSSSPPSSSSSGGGGAAAAGEEMESPLWAGDDDDDEEDGDEDKDDEDEDEDGDVEQDGSGGDGDGDTSRKRKAGGELEESGSLLKRVKADVA
ncbi:Heat shock transcription factor [Tilletia horrida]|nr:Heat shock transcription factor [Tilletia horrida]